ncbi:MAG: ankyrin repeat domain-containing protein [Alphaproteobacteria bacterium]|nr:ankyrin repeat domain-containing protein [Alphaproteobacteria bacterium]
MNYKVTKTDENLNDRFLLACENADIEAARNALSEGAESTAANNGGETALHLSVKSGNKQMVQFALNDLRIPTNVRDNFGRTPLHWSAQQGNVPITEALLLAHANVESKDDMGVEPKIYAEMAGHQELVKIFSLVRISRK